MKVIEYYRRERPVFSFEFFFPKTVQSRENFYRTLEELRRLRPHFVTLTYGAGGSARDSTLEMAGELRKNWGFETVMHLTCIAHIKSEIEEIIARLQETDIENIMALRGDKPKDGELLPIEQRDFKYAADLVSFLRNSGDWCLGVAGYPEGHPEAGTKELDWQRLRDKANAGADYIATQLFFDNNCYLEFTRRMRGLGVMIPIVPGIMPVTNFHQIQKFTAMCGASLPVRLMARLEPVKDDTLAVQEVGIEFATEQCRELLAAGAPGIHFYTLNNSHATSEILRRLSE